MERLSSAKVTRRRETELVSHETVHVAIRTLVPGHPAQLRFLKPGRKLFGYPAAKFKRGNRFFESLVHPQDRVRFESPRASLEHRGKTILNYRVRYADGRYRRLHEPVRCTPNIASPLRKQLVCLVESGGQRLSKELQTRATKELDRMMASRGNVPKRKQAEAALNVSADFTGSLIRCMQDGFSVLNTNGVALEANPAFCHMTGFSRAELVGVGPPHPYWPPEEYGRIQAALSQTMNGGLTDFELMFMRRNGERFPVIVSPFIVKNRNDDTIGYAATVKDITARVQAEAALRASEARHRKLIETMRDGFARVDMAGRILEFNPAFEAMLGYAADALRQKTYVDLTPEKWHAIEACILQEQILVRGYSDVYEKEYRRADGTVFPIELCTVLLRGESGRPAGMWAIVRDITEHKRAEAALRELNENLEHRVVERTTALRESQMRFRELADAAFEGIAITEAGVLLDGNPQLAAMLGYELSEMIGRPVSDFVAPRSKDEVTRRIRNGRADAFEDYLLRKDGAVILVEAHARVTNRNGRRIRITALRDITVARQAERDMTAQRLELARFQRLAEVSEVSLGVIHQIGQPLSSVLANVSAVMTRVSQCGAQRCGARDALAEVDADLKRTRETINRLRALAHPERPHRQPVNLNGLVTDLVRLLQPDADAAQITVQMDLAEGLPVLSVDEVQLTQALRNLLGNALDAVAACVGERRVVTIKTQARENGQVEVSVTDLGVGIDSLTLPQLFEPFFTTKPNGTGVGLRLAQTILKAHGGSVEGCNNDGPGATFRLVLPVLEGNA